MRAVRSSSLLVLAVLANLAALARADAPGAPALDRSAPAPPAQGPAPALDEDMPTAFGVNAPWSWFSGSFGASLFVGIDPRLAMRASAARYESGMPLLTTISALEGDFPSYGGTILDFGLGVVWYPRRLWSGLTVEVGALVRDRETSVRHADGTVDTRSLTCAARGMIGWSWPLGRHLFLAVAAGLSAGRETGQATFTPEPPIDGPATMPIRHEVAQVQVDAEGYFRFGFLFDR